MMQRTTIDSTLAWPTKAHPRQVTLRDGSTVICRPLQASDREALLSFFKNDSGAQRFFLKDDVTSPQVIGDWLRQVERAFALVAESSGRIVGEAALVRRRGKARSHLADVRVVVAEDFRNRGLGTALIGDLCDLARDACLNRVLFEAVEEVRKEALAAADTLGFVRLGLIYGGAIDPGGRLHDIVLLAMPYAGGESEDEFLALVLFSRVGALLIHALQNRCSPSSTTFVDNSP